MDNGPKSRIAATLAGVAALLLAGCVLFPGRIEEGIPKLREKLPEDARVYLACPLNPRGQSLYSRNARLVTEAFEKAFEHRGIATVMPERRSGAQDEVLDLARTNRCSHVLFSQIVAWEYGDAGFSGIGGRDDVTLSVLILDAARERVLTRAKLYIPNGIGNSPMGGDDDPKHVVTPIIEKYVRSIFPDRKDD